MPALIIPFLKLSRGLGRCMHLFSPLGEEAIYNMVGRRSRRAELGEEVCQWSLDFSPVIKDRVGCWIKEEMMKSN